MFILTEKDTGGVYALPNNENVKTVHMFEEEDDAKRYLYQLNEQDYKKKLELMLSLLTVINLAMLMPLSQGKI